jgi:hypothetical protein
MWTLGISLAYRLARMRGDGNARIGGGAMNAQVGDRIVLDSKKVGIPARQGEILQVTPHDDGHVEFRVRWNDGHVSEIRPTGATYHILEQGRSAKP